MSEFSRETLLNIIETDHVQCGEASALARMALAAMDSEPVAWRVRFKLEGQPGSNFNKFFENRKSMDDVVSLHELDGFNIDVTPLYRHAQPAPVAEREPIAWLNDAYLARGVVDGEAGSEDAGPGYIPVYREAGPQPAQVVPEEATPDSIEILASGRCRDHVVYQWDEDQRNAAADSWNACRAAMLEADPQLPGSDSAPVPGSWIPVSERIPEDDDFVYIWPRPDFGVEFHVGQYCERSHKGGGWYAQVYEQNYGIEWHPITVTHWMPLPAGPQEVNRE